MAYNEEAIIGRLRRVTGNDWKDSGLLWLLCQEAKPFHVGYCSVYEKAERGLIMN